MNSSSEMLRYQYRLHNGFLWEEKYAKLKLFGFAFALSLLIFLPFIIFDKGLFLYYGDFDVQQIPFYRLCHEAVQSGSFGWNWNTDLGANFIGSYSFYTLGSPFFWLTIPFPNEWVPYMMAPLLMLKISLSAVTGYCYIHRFAKTAKGAMLGGLLYAFSGFSIYNVFFNHFHEVIVVFPILLIALEEFVINKRRGGFALAVGLCAIVNYYFFFGEVIFCVIYFFVRLRSDDFKLNIKLFGWLVLEAVIGLLLSGVLLVPALVALMGNPRTGDFIEGYNTLIYGNAQRYGLIISSLFFPPDIPARPNFFPDSNAKWSSVSAFLPLFSMVGVITFLKLKRKNFVKTIIVISGIIAMVPFLNAAFSAFNYAYYARWFYMPILFMALATAVTLEEHTEELPFGLKVTAGFVAFFTLIGIMPKKEGDGYVWFSLVKNPERFWAYVLVALFGLLCVWLLVIMTNSHKRFWRTASCCFAAITVAYSAFIIFTGKTEGHGYDVVAERGIYGAQKLSLPDPKQSFYRIDSFDEMDNLGMFLKQPTINAFHSIVPSSVIDYYELVGEQRGVGSRPTLAKSGIRALCNVKYVLQSESKAENVPLGFSYMDTQNGYKVYQNDYFVPMGVGLDYIISKQQMSSAGEYKDRLLLKGLYLDNEEADEKADSSYAAIRSVLPELSDDDASMSKLSSDEDYVAACEALADEHVKSFSYDSYGFWATYTAKKPQAVLFSVPYDKGFSAKVNGQPVEILKANGGFMAVPVNSGQNTIVFTYQTPGLLTGAMVTALGLVLLGGYMAFMFRLRRVNPDAHRYVKTAHLMKSDPSVDDLYLAESTTGWGEER